VEGGEGKKVSWIGRGVGPVIISITLDRKGRLISEECLPGPEPDYYELARYVEAHIKPEETTKGGDVLVKGGDEDD